MNTYSLLKSFIHFIELVNRLTRDHHYVCRVIDVVGEKNLTQIEHAYLQHINALLENEDDDHVPTTSICSLSEYSQVDASKPMSRILLGCVASLNNLKSSLFQEGINTTIFSVLETLLLLSFSDVVTKHGFPTDQNIQKHDLHKLIMCINNSLRDLLELQTRFSKIDAILDILASSVSDMVNTLSERATA